jgi:NAD(P)-dependent dehydrogenase (short-subunit alcohol dehydrogenase family)
MQQLEGRVAAVTGAGGGIGRALAISLAREGMAVAVADVRLDAAEEVAAEIRGEGGRALAVHVDVSERASVERFADRAFEELGPVRLLCNNAGVIARTPILEPDEDGWRWLIDVNLFGVIYGLQTFLPRMIEHGEEGHVVNTASTAGLVPGDRATAYGASKYAVLGVTESLHNELADTPIGVSVLCPHTTRTDLFHHSATHRPEAYGGPTRSAGSIDDLEGSGQAWPDLMDPFETARLVIAGVRSDDLYVITHPEAAPRGRAPLRGVARRLRRRRAARRLASRGEREPRMVVRPRRGAVSEAKRW